MSGKVDAPIESNIATVDCKCDHCGCSLNNKKTVWIWNEHLACSRDHAQRAQAETNKAFKQHAVLASEEIYREERDIDLL